MEYAFIKGDSGSISSNQKTHSIPIAPLFWLQSAPHFSSSGLSIIAICSDGGGSTAGVQLLITLFNESTAEGEVGNTHLLFGNVKQPISVPKGTPEVVDLSRHDRNNLKNYDPLAIKITKLNLIKVCLSEGQPDLDIYQKVLFGA